MVKWGSVDSVEPGSFPLCRASSSNNNNNNILHSSKCIYYISTNVYYISTNVYHKEGSGNNSKYLNQLSTIKKSKINSVEL